MDFYIVIVAAAVLIGLWNLMIAVFGCFPKFRAVAVGTLTKAKTYRNVPARYGRRIPILTRYTYTYTVNGKQYRYSGEGIYTKRRLFSKASMVYVKWFPRHAYPHKFKGTTQWVLGLTMLFLGIFVGALIAVE